MLSPHMKKRKLQHRMTTVSRVQETLPELEKDSRTKEDKVAQNYVSTVSNFHANAITKQNLPSSSAPYIPTDVFSIDILQMQVAELLNQTRPYHEFDLVKAQVTLQTAKDIIEGLPTRGPLNVCAKDIEDCLGN